LDRFIVLHADTDRYDYLRSRSPVSNLGLNKMDRNGYQQLCTGKCGDVGDEGGHLIATALGGSADKINIVPQAVTLNRGDWKAMEREFAQDLSEGKTVSARIDVVYPAGGGVRPSIFVVTPTVGGLPQQPLVFRQ
jgi:filamentous hemagglutinin